MRRDAPLCKVNQGYKLFENLLKEATKELESSDSEYNHEDLITITVNKFFERAEPVEQEYLKHHRSQTNRFIESNCERWEAGLNQLELLYITSQEAGIYFQQQYIKIKDLESDPLLGVLMRLHANALRVSSEIIHLIKGGYADGALARWRTLFEIAVTSLIINKHGKNTAIDYIKHGYIKTVEGIEEYQKTAPKMGLEPYTEEEITYYEKLKQNLSEEEKSWHWALKYTESSKFHKLMKHVELDHWSHNYKLASRSIHADYYEMRSLLGMQEAVNDGLLVGQSNSGMTLPAHMTALSLNIVTSCFLTAYIHEDTELDYKGSGIFMRIMGEYSNRIGETFLKCQEENSK